MPEFVVTLRTGRRVDVEADSFRLIVGGVEFRSADKLVSAFADPHVACVQRRDGFHLKQVWPAVPDA